MNLDFTAEEIAFREEVRAFLERNLPSHIRDKTLRGKHLDRQDHIDWQRILHGRGWMAPAWPEEYGGTGWSPTQRYIFAHECAAQGAPAPVPFGVNMVGPVIYTFGTEAQKKKYLPRILSSEDWWCQGFSEPGAGSDLASLKTRAEDRGDHFLVNGRKIWTTMAHYADRIFCLARTSDQGKPREGISFLLIDMDSPGVRLSPIITIDGAHSVNEVFLDDVRVPKENLVGEEGKGWTYAKFLLGHERTAIAGVGRSKRQVERLKEIARSEQSDGRPLLEDPSFRRRLAEVEVELLALEYTELRVLSREAKGEAPGAEASILKIKGTEIQQALTGMLVEALGYHAMPVEAVDHGRNEPPIGPDYADGVMEDHLYGRAATIYGGSNEIQKNIIAKMVLGF